MVVKNGGKIAEFPITSQMSGLTIGRKPKGNNSPSDGTLRPA
jgi:hypothetical protein